MASKIKSNTITVNYEEYVTDTLVIELTWKDSLGAINDLTSYTGLLEIRSKKTDTLPLKTYSFPGDLVLGSTSPNISIDIPPSDLSDLGVGTFVYFIKLTEPSGRINTLVVGSIKIAAP